MPWRTYAALIGGPLDGLHLDITDWTKGEIDNGTALVAERGRFSGGRTLYDPTPRNLRAMNTTPNQHIARDQDPGSGITAS